MTAPHFLMVSHLAHAVREVGALVAVATERPER